MMDHTLVGHAVIFISLIGGLGVHLHLRPKNGKGRFWERVDLELEFLSKRYNGRRDK
jgi:hypothetical protein